MEQLAPRTRLCCPWHRAALLVLCAHLDGRVSLRRHSWRCCICASWSVCFASRQSMGWMRMQHHSTSAWQTRIRIAQQRATEWRVQEQACSPLQLQHMRSVWRSRFHSAGARAGMQQQKQRGQRCCSSRLAMVWEHRACRRLFCCVFACHIADSDAGAGAGVRVSTVSG